MRPRVPGVLASIVLVVAACQGAATAAPTNEAPTELPAMTSAAAPPTTTPTSTPVDYDALLYRATYDPSAGTPGGKVVIGEWQAATQLDPW